MDPKIISLLESNQLPNWKLAAALVGVDEVVRGLGRVIYELSCLILNEKDPFKNQFMAFTKKGVYINISAWYDYSLHLVFCNGERLVMKNTQHPSAEQVTEYFKGELKKLL